MINTKLLASYALFAELAKEKKNIFEVIRFYIIYYITKNNVYVFDLVDFVQGFNGFYNFKIPRAVLATSLRKLEGCTKQEKTYVIDKAFLPAIQETKFDDIDSKFEEFKTKLFMFFGEENCSEKKSQEILNNLFSFFKDEPVSTSYRKKISKFIISYEDDEFITQQINDLKEGIVIYEGITSDLDLNNIGKWKYKLTLYFTTDILFDLFGLNGEFFKQQAEEFFNLVKEINKDEVFIDFRYFQKTKTEIYSYFFNAKRYITDNEIPKIDTAMNEILKRASTLDGILELKNSFFHQLKNHNVFEDEHDVEKESDKEDDSEKQEDDLEKQEDDLEKQEDDLEKQEDENGDVDGQSFYHSEENYQYNLISDDDQDDFERNDRKRMYMYEPLINRINILRKGKNGKKLNEAKFLLVTRNHRILEIAKEDKFYTEGEFPKAVFLDFLTTRFWFWLNKGFGQKTLCKSLDMFYRSKAVLSSLINANVDHKFKELVKRKKEDPEMMSDKVIKETIVDLRNELKTPEEIEKETLEVFDSILASGDLNQEIEEIETRRQRALEAEKENSALKAENENLKRRIEFWNKILIYILAGFASYFLWKKISPFVVNVFSDKDLIGVIADYITLLGSFGLILALVRFIKWVIPKTVHVIKDFVTEIKQCWCKRNKN